MRSMKKFDYSKGKYYLTIAASPSNVTICRESKKAALDAYNKYCDVGKKTEWLGKWDGKKFLETTVPSEKKVA
jgi:hypothetical protein